MTLSTFHLLFRQNNTLISIVRNCSLSYTMIQQSNDRITERFSFEHNLFIVK